MNFCSRPGYFFVKILYATLIPAISYKEVDDFGVGCMKSCPRSTHQPTGFEGIECCHQGSFCTTKICWLDNRENYPNLPLLG
ncbi:hypothetical protein CRYUN_Cryun27aG0054100 [Craigia yunnanensis]